MLVSVKLLFSMIDHVEADQRTVPDDQRPSADRPTAPGTVPRTGPDSGPPAMPTTDKRTGQPGPSATGGTDQPAGPNPGPSTGPESQPAPVDERTVAHLLPAARVAHATLARDGRSLSRDALADAMRDDGHGVSNARASLLLKIVRSEQDAGCFAPSAEQAAEARTAAAGTTLEAA